MEVAIDKKKRVVIKLNSKEADTLQRMLEYTDLRIVQISGLFGDQLWQEINKARNANTPKT